jgi:hypothetical protein
LYKKNLLFGMKDIVSIYCGCIITVCMKYYFHPALLSLTAYSLIHPLFLLPTLEVPLSDSPLDSPASFFFQTLSHALLFTDVHLSLSPPILFSLYLFASRTRRSCLLNLIFYHIYVTLLGS